MSQMTFLRVDAGPGFAPLSRATIQIHFANSPPLTPASGTEPTKTKAGCILRSFRQAKTCCLLT
jgi:hypothetical protein